MNIYALKDTDWPWDDEDEGRAIVVRADTPQEAVAIATAKHLREFPGAGGVTWDVARLNLVGFQDASWEDDNNPIYAEFTYHTPGINGPPDIAPAPDDLRELREAAERATPGPWDTDQIGEKVPGSYSDEPTVAYVGDYRVVVMDARRYDDHSEDEFDAAFIASANPSTVLSLIARISKLESENARLREELFEAEDIISERDDRLALVDRIADLIGLPHDQELDQTEFELWFSENRAAVSEQKP